ncbi:MAG: sarcinarray family MAST domain-containing protein [Candidatus Methanoperedens sp.]
MTFRNSILILIVLFLNFQIVAGAENEYGIVRAWFNEKNATAYDVQLKIGEPAEVKVEVISKIKGDTSIKLKEPGVTRAFDVLDGPSDEEEWLTNMNIESGWSKTYTWTVAPNGAWKGGNAPLNIVVQFNKGMNDQTIRFTIANPNILDEQYSGAIPTPEATASTAGTQVKETPFLPVIFAVGALLFAWRWRRKKS